MKLLLIQGANLNYLGYRKSTTYGTMTAAELDQFLLKHAAELNYELDIFYTNIEGEAINKVYDSVQQGVDGILANPAGFTYNAYALRDCLKEVQPPYIELHITNIEKRQIHSVLGEVADGIVQGFGMDSYFIALEAMLRILKNAAN